jgi:hypothetical protein
VSIKLNGKDAAVTGFTPLRGENGGLELVVLIDGGARNLGRQFEEITQFVKGLNPRTKATVGYMENGRAVLAGPLSADHAQVAGELRTPAGPSSSAYFSLSDLARNWPSQARGVRREVVMVTDGIDPASPSLDLDDAYVQAAVNDSVRAGLVVYSIWWQSRPPTENSGSGQSLLNEVTQATGGMSYGSGMSNSVSFQSFFDDITRRMENQYELDFSVKPERKPAIETLKLKLAGLGLEVTAPQQVLVTPTSGAGN